MKIVVIIPTYNEADNIRRLIGMLLNEFNKIPQHQFEILVVDDSSPDGTGNVVRRLSEKHASVHLLSKKEKVGLGDAYVYGFKYALHDLHPEALVEMDADFQHDPKDLSKLVAALDKGADYVIGSRYIKGGSIPKEWAFYRKFISLAGNIFTKVVLGIFSVNDFTTGYKISRVKGFVDRINLDEVNSSGFAYKMDLLFKMHRLGAKIVEVPIKFGLRDRGNSKMERENMLDSLRVIILLRYQDSKSFIKFIFVGFAGLFIDSGLFTLLRLTPLGSTTASAVSGFAGMLTTYTLNDLWSFRKRKITGTKKRVTSFALYFISSYIPIIFRTWLIKFSIGNFGDTTPVAYAAFFIGILVGLIWNYTVYSRVIWKKD